MVNSNHMFIPGHLSTIVNCFGQGSMFQIVSLVLNVITYLSIEEY